MEVTYKPLKELVALVIDYRGKTPLKLGGEWTTTGYRALSALNVKTRGLVAEEKIRYVDENLYRKWMKEELHRGDILITSEAPFGQVLQWNSDEKIVLSQRLFALRIKPEYCSSYIYQYMASDFFYGELKARATGSTVEGLRQPALMKCKIAIPQLSTQRRIASILSAYDNLIENNTRRIRLLEQMAENLYKEWFVRFRFPGHEKVEMENGLPKGWKRTKLTNEYKTSSGGTPSRTVPEYYENGNIPWIKTGELQDCVLTDTEEYITENAVKHSSAKLFKKGTLLMAMYGVNIGKLAISNIDATCNQACCVITPKRIESKYYLFYYLKSIRDYLLSISFGAAQQNLSQELIKALKIVMPDDATIISFEQKVGGIYNQIHNFQQQNTLLTRQRDLLLPRLMSGKLEVKK